MTTSVLVAYATKSGSTARIAEIIAEALREQGLQAEVRPAREVLKPAGYDAVVLGGALYAGRWHKAPSASPAGINGLWPVARCGWSAADRWTHPRASGTSRQ